MMDGMWIRAQDMAVGMDRAFDEVDIKADVSDAPTAVDFEAPRDAVVLRAATEHPDPGEASRGERRV